MQVETSLTAERLRTEVSAGHYAVREVRLRLADGTVLEPTFSAETAQARRDTGGGMRIGFGLGGGRRGVGGGVGTSVPVGGRGDTVWLVREARWDDAPVDEQPFTAVVTLTTDPPAVVNVPLGYIDETRAAPAGSDAVRIEVWKLPDGTKRTFAVYEDAGGLRYKPVSNEN